MATRGEELTREVLTILNGGTDDQGNVVEPKGPEYLYSKYPEEFEYYAIAFELVDDAGDGYYFYSMPVMPESLRIGNTPLTNITRTMTGTVVNNNPCFPGMEIKLQGSFGRKMRRITMPVERTQQDKYVIMADGSSSMQTKEYNVMVGNEFNQEWKSGYANTKILERVLRTAAKVSGNQGVYKLFFYNLTFNQALLVEPMQFDFTMAQDKNRIWQYDITLKVLGPASDFNPNTKYGKKYLLDLNKALREGNETAKKGAEAIASKDKQGRGLLRNSKIQKLLDTEVGRRVYQAGVAYTPDVLSTAFQLAENPSTVQNFTANAGNNILNTGNIF